MGFYLAQKMVFLHNISKCLWYSFDNSFFFLELLSGYTNIYQYSLKMRLEDILDENSIMTLTIPSLVGLSVKKGGELCLLGSSLYVA